MEIVKTVKRINALKLAINRVPNDERYWDVFDALWDKKEALVKSLKDYKGEAQDRKDRLRRHINIRLACRLLKIDHIGLFH